MIFKARDAVSRSVLDEAESRYASALKLVQQNQIEEASAVVCLRGLGDVYLARGKSSKVGEDFTKASALYNSALVRCHPTAANTREQLTILIKETEKEFLFSVLSDEAWVNSGLHNGIVHKNTLDEIRLSCKKKIDEIDLECYSGLTSHDIEEMLALEKKQIVLLSSLFNRISRDMIAFVQTLIRECVLSLGKPPCLYAVIGLGSLAREEMTPYSDLEFAILIEEGAEEMRDRNLVYFRNFTHLFHLKVLALGETILPSMNIASLNDFYSGDPERNWFYDEGPNGFSFDGAMPWACKFPLGRKKTERKEEIELIKTPNDMATLQTEKLALKEGYHLADVLARSIFIEGNEDLEETYRRKVREILNTQSSASKEWSTGRKRGFESLRETFEEFKKTANDWEEAGKVFDVKREVYRFPTLVLSSVVLYYDLNVRSPGEAIDQLLEMKKITENAAHHLRFTVAVANELRLRSYFASGEQHERITGAALPRDRPKTTESKNQQNAVSKLQRVFHVPNPEIIFRLFRTVIPLQKAVEKFLSHDFANSAADVNQAILSGELYDDSPTTQAIIFFRFCEFEKARACLEPEIDHLAVEQLGVKEDLSRVSKLFDTLLKLGNVCLAQGDIQGAVNNFDKATQLESLYGEHDERQPYFYMLLTNLGRAYYSIGEYKKALSLHEKALSLKEEAGETSVFSITESVNGIAVAYMGLENYEKAAFHFNKSLDLVRRSGGSAAVSSAYTLPLINMMSADAMLGNLDKVKESYREVSRIFPSLYGVGVFHPHMASALTNLATAYKQVEAYEEAATLYQQALVMRDRLHGFDTTHPAMSSLLSNLGHTYYNLNQLVKAEEYCTKALEIKKETYKEQFHHPSMIGLLKLLGSIHLSQGNVHAAVQAFEEDLHLLRVVHRDDIAHKEVCAALNSLGYAYYEFKDFNKAVACLEEARSLWFRNLGGYILHRKLATCLNNLGNSYRKLNQFQKALECCREGLGMRNALQGGAEHSCSDAEVAKSFTDTGHCFTSLGDYNNAVSHYERALQLRLKLGQDVASSYNDLANGYSRLGEHAKAIEHYKNAICYNEEKYGAGKTHADCMYPSLSNLGSEYVLTGEYDEAVKVLEQGLKLIKDDSSGSHSQDIGIALNDLGAAYRNLKQYNKAKNYLKQALEVRIKLYGGEDKPHPELASTLTNLGNVCTNQGKYDEAIEYYTKALEMKRALHGPNHHSIALTLNNIGSLYIQVEQYDKAVDHIKEALQIFSITFGDGRPNRETGLSFCTLGQAYEGLKDFRAACGCYERAVKILALFYGNASHPLLTEAIANWKRLRHMLT